MGDENMNSDEMKQTLIDFYVNLQRIKQAETGINPELDYQLKIYKNKSIFYSVLCYQGLHSFVL